MGASRWFFSISGVILLVGALALATKQLNFGIDFESGTRIKVALVKPTDEEGVRETLDAVGITGEEIQQVSDPVLGDNVFQIQTSDAGTGPGQRGAEGARRRVRDRRQTASTAPASGRPSASRSPTAPCKALIFSLLVICAYIALRFDPKFAVPVLIAIFHDILITAGVYSLTGREVSSGTVAAFLTILGYSLYDTIIVFDRITREHAAHAAGGVLADRQPLDERGADPLAGDQLHDPARRSISLLIFGGATLQDFAFAMLVGIALRYLLVDLHRLAGADRLEGTRAGLRRAAASGSPQLDGTRPGLRRRRRAGRSSATTTRPKRRSRTVDGGRARGAAAGRRRGDRRARTTADGAGGRPNGETAAAETASAERRERNAERREGASARKHGGPQAREEAVTDGTARLVHDGDRPLALHRLPARPLLAGHRRRLPRRGDRRRASSA